MTSFKLEPHGASGTYRDIFRASQAWVLVDRDSPVWVLERYGRRNVTVITAVHYASLAYRKCVEVVAGKRS